MPMRLSFLVDCGMFQGGRDAQRKNRRFAFDPRQIAAQGDCVAL